MDGLQANRKKFSRRRFLQATGALSAAAALTSEHPSFLVKLAQAAEDTNEVQQELIHTLCGACPNSCVMTAVLKNGRLTQVKGVPTDWRTQGHLCAKSLSASQRAYDPRRIHYPLRRTGERGKGEFKRISWDEALDELGKNIMAARAKHGPHSVAFCRGQGSNWGFQYDILQRLTHCVGTEVSMGGTECFIPRVIGHVFTYASTPFYGDYENADLIIFWGRQPAFSGAPMASRIFDARDRGAKIVVVDPLHFHIAARADQYIPIEAGTDLAMFLAMMYVTVEQGLWDHDFVDTYTNDPGLTKLGAHLRGENRLKKAFTPEWAAPICGVDAEVIRALAIEYATTPRAVLETGHGLEGRLNVTQTARANAILRAITGHFDRIGCDVNVGKPPRNPAFFLEDRVVKDYVREKPVTGFAVPPYNPPMSTYPLEFKMQGLIATPDVMREMEEGKTKVAVVIAGNPVVMGPQPKNVIKAFNKVDFVAVHDSYITETAKWADLVLPAGTYLERRDPEWRMYETAQETIGLRRRAIPPVGESLPDQDFIIRLGQAMGFTKEFPSNDIDYYIDLLLKPSKITAADLEKYETYKYLANLSYEKYKKTGFGLPGGRLNIHSVVLEKAGFDPLPVWIDNAESYRSAPKVAADYPLMLLTGRPSPMHVHSDARTFPWVAEIRPEALVWIHPRKAAELGIANGDMCVVESPRGSITIRAEISTYVRESDIYIPGGWAEANFNELGIDDQIDPISSQWNYMTCLGRIRKA
ncbi:MAG: molybdopterin-dependent oxidoreductase [Desulfobulbaceae bacterium]|nr:molybdopterin-dependent oxidoreductase [Desulfobulbaceae bacterium]